MANTGLIQIRAAEEDKKQSSEILVKLGTNLSAVVNMMLKQIILTESIPFEVALHPAKQKVTISAIDAVNATMALEGFNLNADDIDLLEYYSRNAEKGDEIRKKILNELRVDNE